MRAVAGDRYAAILERLLGARGRVIADWPGFVHRFAAPVDPAWPAPLQLRSAELGELRDRLGWDAWRVCLWTAAEMALPVFAAHAARRSEADADDGAAEANGHRAVALQLEPAWIAAAHRVVDVAHAVLWEGTHPLDLFEAAAEFFLVEPEALVQPGRYAWYAIRNALHGWTGGVRHFVQARLAADAVDPAQREAPAVAFDQWWQRCRCRLAFADAAVAQLSEESRRTTQSVVTRAIVSRHPRRSDASSLVLHWLNKAGDGRGTADSPEGPPSPPDEEEFAEPDSPIPPQSHEATTSSSG